jgi:hypothetical protein
MLLPARALPTKAGGFDLALQAMSGVLTSIIGPTPSALNFGSQE